MGSKFSNRRGSARKPPICRPSPVVVAGAEPPPECDCDMTPHEASTGTGGDQSYNLTYCCGQPEAGSATCYLYCDAGEWDYSPHSVPNCESFEEATWYAPYETGTYRLRAQFTRDDVGDCWAEAYIEVTEET